jgi:hypothetical protein
MTRASPRAKINSSRLIGLLTDLAVAEAQPPQQNFAELLGQILDLADAIKLSAANERRTAVGFDASSSDEEAVSIDALEAEVLRVRSGLVNTIVKSCTPPGSPPIPLPAIKDDTPVETAIAYERYHRFYAAHQRDLHANVRSLQSHVRDVLSAASPQLKQLAALDATFDEILWGKMRKIFSTIPKLLEIRFEALLQAHQATLNPTNLDDNPTRWMLPGGWIERFCKELQELLLAELDVRLQPVLGLVDAFRHEVYTNQ